MSTEQAAKDFIYEFLLTNFGLTAEQVSADMPLFSSKILSSIDAMRLVAALKKNAMLSDTKLSLKSIDTVNDLLALCA